MACQEAARQPSPTTEEKHRDGTEISGDHRHRLAERFHSRDDSHEDSTGKWYLPHHPLTNINKPGKVRRVLNASSIYKGVSLNSNLLTGPDLLTNLTEIVMRFRDDQIAISADIEAMFIGLSEPRGPAVFAISVEGQHGPTRKLPIHPPHLRSYRLTMCCLLHHSTMCEGQCRQISSLGSNHKMQHIHGRPIQSRFNTDGSDTVDERPSKDVQPWRFQPHKMDLKLSTIPHNSQREPLGKQRQPHQEGTTPRKSSWSEIETRHGRLSCGSKEVSRH